MEVMDGYYNGEIVGLIVICQNNEAKMIGKKVFFWPHHEHF